jgi:hypothetical protein
MTGSDRRLPVSAVCSSLIYQENQDRIKEARRQRYREQRESKRGAAK